MTEKLSFFERGFLEFYDCGRIGRESDALEFKVCIMLQLIFHISFY